MALLHLERRMYNNAKNDAIAIYISLICIIFFRCWYTMMTLPTYVKPSLFHQRRRRVLARLGCEDLIKDLIR